MNPRFRAAVTSQAFSLTLSQRHIEYLLCMAVQVRPVHFPTSVSAFWQLERRGLVYAKRDGEPVHEGPTNEVGLTTAGELTIALLIEAGFKAAIELRQNMPPAFGNVSEAVTVTRSTQEGS